MTKSSNKKNLELVDIGANLTHKDFSSDLDAVIDEALNKNISKIIVTGTTGQESLKARKLTKNYSKIMYSTAGVHPHNADDYCNSEEKIIKELSTKSNVVAIGECGLDYYRNYSTKANQFRAFQGQIEIAHEQKLPLFMHQRDAHEDFISLLRSNSKILQKGVVHCFTGTKQMLHEYLEMDLYIGITGWICDERRGKKLQSFVKDIPLERLLIETDCPYLVPRTLQKRPKNNRNEPKFLIEVLDTIEKLTPYSKKEIADATFKNACDLFNLI